MCARLVPLLGLLLGVSGGLLASGEGGLLGVLRLPPPPSPQLLPLPPLRMDSGSLSLPPTPPAGRDGCAEFLRSVWEKRKRRFSINSSIVIRHA